MNKEPDNFPLFPHLRERSNKGIDRHTQRSKWVTELLDWPNLPNDLLAAAKEAEFCLRDQVIVLFVCDSGARPSEVIELSIVNACVMLRPNNFDPPCSLPVPTHS
jgi:hypothetical protein